MLMLDDTKVPVITSWDRDGGYWMSDARSMTEEYRDGEVILAVDADAWAEWLAHRERTAWWESCMRELDSTSGKAKELRNHVTGIYPGRLTEADIAEIQKAMELGILLADEADETEPEYKERTRDKARRR